MLNHILRQFARVLICLMMAAPATAQSFDDPFLFSVREPASAPDEAAGLGIRADATRPGYQLILVSFGSASDGMELIGAAGTLRLPATLPVPADIRFQYRSLDFEDGDDLQQLVSGAKLSLISFTPGRRSMAVALAADYTRTFDTADRIDVAIGADRRMMADGTLEIGASMGWSQAERDGASAVEDIVPSFSGRFRPVRPRTGETSSVGPTLQASYRADNDVDGEDTFSFEVQQVIPAPGVRSPVLSLAVRKHRTISLSLAWVLNGN